MSDNVPALPLDEAREQERAVFQKISRPRGIRHKADTYLLGLPLYEIALGPNPKRRENFGDARAIFAIGDRATGVVAIGAVARGLVAVGGVAVGLVSCGGVSFGLVLGIGGCAFGTLAVGGIAGGLFALGGIAIGGAAIGGVAAGYYACGGVTYGTVIIDSISQDAKAINMLSSWLPFCRPLIHAITGK